MTDDPVLIGIVSRAVALEILRQPVVRAVDLDTTEIVYAVVRSLREHGPNKAVRECIAAWSNRDLEGPGAVALWDVALGALLQSRGGGL